MNMKRLCATVAVLALSGGIALAQSSGGSSAGGSPGGAASPGSSTTGPTSPTGPATPGAAANPGSTVNPSAPATPGAVPPSPADSGTTGRAPGVNPANSQDVTRRGNPQDLTLPRGVNPQDSKAPGTPQIYKPER
jgi:hypothetical protein